MTALMADSIACERRYILSGGFVLFAPRPLLLQLSLCTRLQPWRLRSDGGFIFEPWAAGRSGTSSPRTIAKRRCNAVFLQNLAFQHGTTRATLHHIAQSLHRVGIVCAMCMSLMIMLFLIVVALVVRRIIMVSEALHRQQLHLQQFHWQHSLRQARRPTCG